MTTQDLIDAAVEARANAYAPFSKFLVGAAALGDDDRVYRGANVENSSYGLTICAERVAVGAAVTAGVRRIEAIAIAASRGPAPCGACRQFLYEFGPQMRVLLVDADGAKAPRETTLTALLPDGFRLDVQR